MQVTTTSYGFSLGRQICLGFVQDFSGEGGQPVHIGGIIRHFILVHICAAWQILSLLLFRSKLCQVWWFWGWSLWNPIPRAMSSKSACSAQEGGPSCENYTCWFLYFRWCWRGLGTTRLPDTSQEVSPTKLTAWIQKCSIMGAPNQNTQVTFSIKARPLAVQ